MPKPYTERHSYRQYMSNIAYRHKFEVVYEEGRILKVENGMETVLADTDSYRPSVLEWKAWLKLWDDYGWDGRIED